jgi:hypothetical protein
MRLPLAMLINRRHLRPITAAAILVACGGAQANEVPGYGFESAAQEITQLFWLAETANVCAWATRDDADWFKLFSMRFLSDHLSERNRLALVSMVTQDSYEKAVRQAAQEGAGENCASRRWELGWASYLSAAVAHDSELGATR